VGALSVANDGTIGYTAGGAGDWQANTAYSNSNQLDAFIYPSTNNSGKVGYQAAGSCTSGGTEPNWGSSTAGCPAAGNTCSEGSCTWTNIGKIGGQGPGFDVLYFSPTRGCRRLNTMTGNIFNGTNENSSYPGTGGVVSSRADADGQRTRIVQLLPESV
jgi:hypothetical protein